VPAPTLFSNLGPNLYGSFIGVNSLLHLAGIGITYGLVEKDIDYRVQQYFSRHPTLDYFFDPVTMTGMLLPVFGSGAVYLYGKYHPDRELYGAGCALIQANAVDFVYTSLLKAVTGRPHPDNGSSTDMLTQSKTFRFGFMRGGIFWGWPSGHTAATMTTAACLANYYPDNIWVKIGGYAMVAYTMVGVAAVGGGHMHWFSEGVAGAVMNYAVGSTIGRSYRRLMDGKPEKKTGLELMPVVAEDYQWVDVRYSFK
jgi:membrane-associated phospholipid phosphatase